MIGAMTQTYRNAIVAALVALAPLGYESHDIAVNVRSAFNAFKIGDVTLNGWNATAYADALKAAGYPAAADKTPCDDGDGCTASDLRLFKYEKIRRPLYPFDPDMRLGRNEA